MDLSGKFVMPGIIDSHIHVGMMKDVTQDEKFETPENVTADLKIYAAYGVTAVQVLGTDKDFVLDMRNQQRKGRPNMARLFSAGRFTQVPPACVRIAGGHLLHCRIGQGEAWLVGDADMLFAPLWQPQPRWAAHLRHADTMEWLDSRLR